MNALIIGGTGGFGKEVSCRLHSAGYDIATVSRSPSRFGRHPHYQCEVGDLPAWHATLQRIKGEYADLDFLACVVGYARAKPSRELSPDDWNHTLAGNLTYVALALEELTNALLASKDPRALTIGSQWSYKTGNDVLVPYTVAKHALRTLTEDFAQRNPTLNINHYCVPTMNTPGYWEVRKSFQDVAEESTILCFTPDGLADPRVVAKTVIDKALRTDVSGSTFIIKPDGIIERL